MKTEYRFYSFTNLYISDIQKGIQTAHVVSEMLKKYREPDRIGENYDVARKVYIDWVENDKTIIVLQGGPSDNLRKIHSKLKTHGHALRLPFVNFHEDEFSLDGALTAVGIVVPDYVYDYKWTKTAAKDFDFQAERNSIELHQYLQQFKLA